MRSQVGRWDRVMGIWRVCYASNIRDFYIYDTFTGFNIL